MAAIFEHSRVITLHPKPGFVVKTKIVEGGGDHLYQTKVFINVCHDAQVPKPEGTFEPSRIFPLIVKNEWEIPIIVSLEKKSLDKKGIPSFVYDCCINSECFSWLTISADLRMIAIEWCIESVEMMHELVLEREYSVPKMLSKGDLSATEITQDDLNNSLSKKLEDLKENETAGLVQELFPDEEDEKLPDLMNLAGKKPLIEEIKELSLDSQSERNKSRSLSQKKSTNTAPEANTTEESELISEVSSKSLKGSLDHKKINYEFTVKQKTRGTELVIVLESMQLTPSIQLFFQNNRLKIQNNDPTRQLGPDNELSLPVPDSHTPYKSFLVTGESSLYVFMNPRTKTH